MIKVDETTGEVRVDAGYAAAMMTMLKPALEGIKQELERPGLPESLYDMLNKKRLSIETLINMFRGNRGGRDKSREDYYTGVLNEDDFFVSYVLLGENAEGDLLVWECDDEEIEELEQEMIDNGYVVNRYQVIPEFGYDLGLYWPATERQLEEYREQDEYFRNKLVAQGLI